MQLKQGWALKWDDFLNNLGDITREGIKTELL